MLKMFSKKAPKPNGRIKRKVAVDAELRGTDANQSAKKEQERRKRSVAAKRAQLAQSRLQAQQAQTKKMLRMIRTIVRDDPAAAERVIKAWIAANGSAK